MTALDDLSFTLPRGLVGLVGANGAGKTTMFRLLLGLSRPTEGAIEVCGINVAADPRLRVPAFTRLKTSTRLNSLALIHVLPSDDPL